MPKEHAGQGRNLRDVDMRKYAKVEMEDEVYTVSVDADAIVKDFHLPNPKTTNLDLSRFPDVETVYSLTFLVTPRQEGGWSIQTGSDRPTAAEDLRRGGLRLVNTEWTWTEQDMKNAYRDSLEYPRRLSMKKYVLCGKNTMGGYVLTVDHERMLRATGWDLPEDESVRKAHTGYKAIVSLGYYVSPLTDGFLVETSSTLENVYAMLLDNGVRLTDTTWVYSLAEVEDAVVRWVLYGASAFVYLLFLHRFLQILSLSCNPLRTFLYLCGLEFFPAGLLAASAAL